MILDEAEIHSLTADVWGTMLNLDLRRLDSEEFPGAVDGFLTGSVYISGAWQGVAAVSCSVELARRIASIMMGCSDLPGDVVRDAIGELTNITAGQVQSRLPRPSELSVPSVIKSTNCGLDVPRSAVLGELFFECMGETLSILVAKDGRSGD